MSKATAAPLSNDTIFDILSRTPVRSVCQFRCVSRGWHDLISGPDFAAAQRNTRPGHHMRLMDMEGNVIRVIRVIGGFGITCSSSLDNLIAVSRGPSNDSDVVDPAIGEVLLTCPGMEARTLDVHPFIAMAHYEEHLWLRPRRTAAWRRTQSPPITLPPVAVNGIMYFLADEKRETLLCFDIESEQWKANMIKGPPKGARREMRRTTTAICITELDNAMSMVVVEKQDNRSTNIWILGDSGKINWFKAYSIPMTPYTIGRYMPLMVTPGGGKLLLQCHVAAQSVILQIYDPRTNTSTHVMKVPK
ncbi:hypothetical protein VPH35_042783 [Triticum aestivum]